MVLKSLYMVRRKWTWTCTCKIIKIPMATVPCNQQCRNLIIYWFSQQKSIGTKAHKHYFYFISFSIWWFCASLSGTITYNYCVWAMEMAISVVFLLVQCIQVGYLGRMCFCYLFPMKAESFPLREYMEHYTLYWSPRVLKTLELSRAAFRASTYLVSNADVEFGNCLVWRSANSLCARGTLSG